MSYSLLRVNWCRVAVMCAVVLLSLASSESARAASTLSWSAPALIDHQPTTSSAPGVLPGISCPSASLCVAVDNAGNVVTSTNPAGGASTWTVTHVDGSAGSNRILTGISCPSASLCVAVDQEGDVVTSTDPTGGASAWRVAHVNGIYSFDFASVSCPSMSLCVAVDTSGNAVSSADPTGGPSAWNAVHADPTMLSCGPHGSNECQAPLLSVSCPTASLCVAFDEAGNVVTSTNPTGDASAWTVSNSVYAIFPPGPTCDGGLCILVSCPSASSCVAVDSAGNTITSTNPTGGAKAWTVRQVDLANKSALSLAGFSGISCPSPSFCVALDAAGNAVSSTNPTTHMPVWTFDQIDAPISGPSSVSTLTGVSCPSTIFCVAVDYAGHAIVGTPVTRTEIRQALRNQMAPFGRAAKIAAILKHGGYSLSFRAPTSGRLTISWYLTQAHLVRRKAKQVLIATGQASIDNQSATRINIKLTHKGKQLIKHAKHLKLTLKGSFTPTGDTAVLATRTVRLNR